MLKSTICVITLSLLIAEISQATIYKSIGNRGEVIYSDKKLEGASEVEVVGLTTFDSASQPQSSSSSQVQNDTQQEPLYEYDTLTITSPAHEESVYDAQGNLTISTLITPELQKGHEIVFLMDSQEVARGPIPNILLQNINRGEHQISTEIHDDQGTVLKRSAVVTVFIKRPIIRSQEPESES